MNYIKKIIALITIVLLLTSCNIEKTKEVVVEEQTSIIKIDVKKIYYKGEQTIMATALEVEGKEFLLQSILDSTTLVLKLVYNAGAGPVLLSNVVDYTTVTQSGGNAYTDLVASSTFTIPASGVVSSVTLDDGTNALAIESITTDNSFPNGGDFIVTSFKITVA